MPNKNIPDTRIPKNLKSMKDLNKLIKGCQKETYIFRGINKIIINNKKEPLLDRVNCGIYRSFSEKNDSKKEYSPFSDNFKPIDIEKEIVRKARQQLFPDKTSELEILTDLQHFKGKTCLIDFSESLFIALFFVCNGDIKGDGELFLIKKAKFENPPELTYDPLPKENIILKPKKTPTSQNRTIFQSSIFIHTPSGFLKPAEYIAITVAENFKKELQDYLAKFHNINSDTVYNDLFGFIDNENNYRTANLEFYLGLAAANNFEYQKAIDHFTEHINLVSNIINKAMSYINRGNSKNELGQFAEAIKDYNKAIELNPNYAAAYSNRGNAKDNLGEPQAAIEDCNKAIELNPNSALAYNNRGNAKNKLGQHQAAIEDYTKAIELNPNEATAYNNRGNAKYELGELKEAIKDYNKAIELNPNEATAYNNRGSVKNNLGEHQAAIEDYNKAIELNPDYADAYYNRGIAKQDLGEHQAAIEDYNKAIELNPDYADAYYNRGIAKQDLREYQAAIEDYNKAIELDPNYADAYCNRGIAYILLKEFLDAINSFQQLLNLKKILSPLKKMGLSNRIKELKQLLEKDKTNPEVLKLSTVLDNLQKILDER